MPSPEQRRKLRDALIDAFPDKSSLEQLLYFRLDKNLNEITRDSSLEVIVFELIKKAESEGWLINLVGAARDERPGNGVVQAIAQEILSNEATISSSNISTKPSNQYQKILILAANPIDTSQLQLDEELHTIEKRLRRERLGEQFEIKSVLAARVGDIYHSIVDFNPQIVHFSGGGGGQDGLVFTDETGQVKLFDAVELTKLFKLFANRVKCVVLNACYSPIQARAITQHIDYVIGISQAVIDRDRAVIDFLVGFYDALWAGESIEFAYEIGCTLINYTSIPVLKKRTQTKYYQGLINKYQRYQTEGLSKDYALDLPEVFVPLKIVAIWKNNARSELIKQVNNRVNNEREYQVWDFLVATVDKHAQRGMVVLGGPGAGKSTLLRHITIIYASEEQHKYNPKAPELIPVLLFIRDVYEEIVKKTISLVDLIDKEVKQIIQENEIIQLVSRWLLEELKRKEGNKFLIMLDGLDEVAAENQRQHVSAWVDEQIQAYPNTAFILTSRPRGYKTASLKNARITVEVQPFKLPQVRVFIHKWYLAIEKERNPGYENSEIKEQAKQQAEDLINRIRNSSPLAAMAVNPLLLTMISTIHHRLSLDKRSLPEKRVELYKEMCEVLLETRQKEKNYNDKLINKDNKSVLQVLALKLMEQQASEFELTDGVSWIQKPLEAVVSKEVKPEEFINYICESVELLVVNDLQCYQFAHLSFQEYLAACEIKKSKREELLISNIGNSWWAETIRLYAAQSDATRLISVVLDMQSPSVEMMALAYDCLEECLRADKNVRRKLLQRLEDGLKSTDPEIFKLAAQVSLIRRFRNFLRLSEESEIDKSYVTCAEYQLFLDETGESCQPQHWRHQRFLPGDAKKTITGSSWENALRFCAWLGQWYRRRLGNQLSEIAVHYRLAEEEKNQGSINDDRQFTESGIRLVKFQLPSKYSKLADYLWSGEWEKADEETHSVMLSVVGRESVGYLDEQAIKSFPCLDLRIIDFLWIYASKGHFGFSVQKNIYQSLEGASKYKEKVWNDFGDHVGWRVKERWKHYARLTFDTRAPKGHLPYLRVPHLPQHSLWYQSSCP